ncbi:glycosyltransferase family 2 protein [Rufibacter tibetensis]|uniref:Glycosyl transferase n=1 Tax=Rufibacter tibetensis TaxID=512763 RepID=A0A0P0C048_9BACT|nr:glycosyltransferase [Rufibacter tibetensis]ALI98172.1 glycosyl transferase [Rufibacter tibetensis]
MTEPLVSIICLCYNHASFLREALDSVLDQTYPKIEILIVDDLSTDNSVEIIQDYVHRFPAIRFIRHTQNQGNCASFNEALLLSQGEFIIDFATDDVLYPDRVALQVEAFQKLGATYGVVYTDAELIDEQSTSLGFFYARNASGQLFPKPVQGDVFSEVLGRYFICPPTMMIRRLVLEELKGYDPELAYEDFDFWVRSSRNWKYHFLDQVLCQRRMHPHSLSRRVYQKGDKQLASTVKVIQKAQKLVRTPLEREALKVRIKYEARHAYLTANYAEAAQLLQILQEEGGMTAVYKLLRMLTKQKVPLQFLRRWYHRWRYGHTSA